MGLLAIFVKYPEIVDTLSSAIHRAGIIVGAPWTACNYRCTERSSRRTRQLLATVGAGASIEVRSVDFPIPDLTPEAARFVAMFSRLKYAMKRCPAFRQNRSGYVEANWAAFQNCPEIAALFAALAQAPEADELVQRPPKQRVEAGGNLPWGNAPAACADMPEVVRGLKNVRNNLFHGEKGTLQTDRDVKLYSASIAVMNAMLNARADVAGHYIF